MKIGTVEVRADQEHAGRVAHERRLLDLGADHDARRVAEEEHRDVEGVAELHEARAPCRRRRSRSRRRGAIGLLAMTPSGRPSTRIERGDHAEPEVAADLEHRAVVGERLDHLAHVVDAQPVLRDDAPHQALVRRLPVARPALEVREVLLRHGDGLGLVRAPAMSTTPFGTWTSIGPISSGANTPRPPPSIIAGPPMPMFEPSVAMIDVAAAEQRGVAGEAAAGGDADHRHEPAELRELREGVRVGRRPPPAVGVAAAARRRPRRTARAAARASSRDLEHAVRLAVVAARPGCRRRRCSRRRSRAVRSPGRRRGRR